MRKNLTFLMLVLAVLFSLNAHAYDVKVDGIYYELKPMSTVAEVTSGDVKYTGDVDIPSSFEKDGITYSVTKIGLPAFWGCSGLTSVTIPNSVTSIQYGAFWGCSGLTSVTIPNSVTSIGNGAFEACSGLTSVTIPNSVTSIGNGAFKACSGLTSVTIPNSVTSIGGGAFEECTGLNSIKVGNGNTVYDSRNNCNAIIETSTNILIGGCKNTIIPNSVTSIGDYAFLGCSGMTSVTIPNGVTSIGYMAFYACIGLTSVTIPNNVTSIGDWAFSGCSGLTSVKVQWNRPLAGGADSFHEDVKKSATLYVPKGTAMMYMAAAGWSEFVNIMEYEDGEDVHYITIRMGDGGVLKQSVDVGQTYTYVVNADEGWEVNTLTFDGKDITSSLLDGQFSTPVITGNSELNVVFKQKDTSVKAMPSMSEVKVYASNKSITINGAEENAPVSVYGINGALVTSAVGNATFTLESGVYVVKVGEETFKVRL